MPWVNDTVIVFVLDMPQYTVSIGTEPPETTCAASSGVTLCLAM